MFARFVLFNSPPVRAYGTYGMETKLGRRVTRWASRYTERGLSVIPMGTDKKPLRKWKPYQTRIATQCEIQDWAAPNVAIVTGEVSGVVVVDCDTVENARWFWRNRGKTTVWVRTRRGVHLYFRHPGQPVRNAAPVYDSIGVARYDIRGDGGYVMAPPSVVRGHVYRWGSHDWGRLPTFRMEWRPNNGGHVSKEYTDGIKYISKIVAVDGQGGHNDTFRAVCVLREAGLSESEALAAMVDWNQTNAHGPWSTQELLHKVRQVYG